MDMVWKIPKNSEIFNVNLVVILYLKLKLLCRRKENVFLYVWTMNN